jgi:hypothetical protein
MRQMLFQKIMGASQSIHGDADLLNTQPSFGVINGRACGYASCLSPQVVPPLENMWWLFRKTVSASWNIHTDTVLLKTPNAGVINSCCCWLCSMYGCTYSVTYSDYEMAFSENIQCKLKCPCWHCHCAVLSHVRKKLGKISCWTLFETLACPVVHWFIVPFRCHLKGNSVPLNITSIFCTVACMSAPPQS